MPVQQQATAWVVGNVAYPPEQAGKGNSQRVRLRVLNNRGWYDRTKREWVDRPANGTEVICWGDLARNAAASVEVGDPVVVFGRLEENLWTDSEGASHRKTRVVADVVAHDLSRGQSKFSRITLGDVILKTGDGGQTPGPDDPWSDAADGDVDQASVTDETVPDDLEGLGDADGEATAAPPGDAERTPAAVGATDELIGAPPY